MKSEPGGAASILLSHAIELGYVLLAIALIFSVLRAFLGPRQEDRLAALEHSWLVSIGLMSLFALQTHAWRVLDLALAFALLGSIAPAAWAWALRRKASVPKRNPSEGGTGAGTY